MADEIFLLCILALIPDSVLSHGEYICNCGYKHFILTTIAYRFRVFQTSDMLFIATYLEAKGTINLISLNGKKIGQLHLVEKGIYSIPKSSLQGESVIIGNAQCGYQKIITVN